jgi:anti-sigma B factor antagonist
MSRHKSNGFKGDHPMFELEISRIPDGTGLKLSGELDVATAPELTKALLDLSPANTRVTLDLTELTFVDSCGIRAILALARSANGNGPVVLLNPTEAVSRVFEILGLDGHVGIEVQQDGQLPKRPNVVEREPVRLEAQAAGSAG